MTQSQFKQLQRKWYNKLKDSGFEDIEDTNSPKELLKSWHDIYFHKRHTFVSFRALQIYYQNCRSFLNTHPFQSHTERMIWQMHTDGYALRQISIQMKALAYKANKDTIGKIINRLKAEMNERD